MVLKMIFLLSCVPSIIHSVTLLETLVELYVDHIVIKIKSHASLLDNLALVFDRLC
jgi:hypothetical protein